MARDRRSTAGRSASRRAPAAAGGQLEARLARLAHNLWWTWSPDAQQLFASIEPREWAATRQHPLETLRRTSPERLDALRADDGFLERMRAVEADLEQYLSARTWFQKTHGRQHGRTRIAYFCAEFALHASVPLYAGGLGVLAGDHLKAASDLGIPLVAVGLLYRRGYYRHGFQPDGRTRIEYPQLDLDRLPAQRTGVTVSVPIGRRGLRAHVWRIDVGRTPLYLLDADHPRNPPALRAVTQTLYGGDNETRIHQEILLGVGGVMALEALQIPVSVYHLNEGHAAFSALWRLRELVAGGLKPEKATEQVRRQTLFTTHTPVPAGHDRFETRRVRQLLGPGLAPLDAAAWTALGAEADRPRSFCMTALALRLSGQANGVSALHGEVSREMWQGLFEAAAPADVPIGHITNGVHPQTWLAPEIVPLYRRYLKPRWTGMSAADDPWKGAERIPPAEFWEMRNRLRAGMIHFVRQRLADETARRGGSAADVAQALRTFDPGTLTIGFARRFATYKRAPLVFRDRARLARILANPHTPVQIIFAGKPHPKDMDGQEFARQLFRHASTPAFAGRVAVLEDYDMHVGRLLTSGCDVWLNNPIRPMEASGTSGMKPPLHGGLNCSILDGWWPEAYDGQNGWAIDGGRQRSGAAQDRADAEAIYELLESQIVPLFYERDRAGVPRRWVKRMAASMRTVCAPFSAQRMVAEYTERYYLPAAEAGRAKGRRR